MSIAVPEFLDADGYIRAELLDKEAKDIAGQLKSKRITTHQVRKFYDEVKKYQGLLDKNEPYKKIKPLIIMLKSKAKYASTKKPKMKIFYEFIKQSIDKIKTGGEDIEKKKFHAFCLFFEAVYGFADLKNS
jgi:CRISPR-associated protein Csm2